MTRYKFKGEVIETYRLNNCMESTKEQEMSKAEHTVESLAELALSHMHLTGRTDEERICAWKPGAPEWCKVLAWAAHGEGFFLPNNWRYEFIFESLSLLADGGSTDEIETSIYVNHLLSWVSSHLLRPEYCDEAMRDGLVPDDATLAFRIAAGQLREKQEVYEQVRRWLEDHLEDYEEQTL